MRVLTESFMGSNLQLAMLAYARVDFAAARADSFCTLEGITVEVSGRRFARGVGPEGVELALSLRRHATRLLVSPGLMKSNRERRWQPPVPSIQ